MSESDLPAPPYPADTDLRKLDWVKVWRRRLLDSDTWKRGPSAVRGAAMTLWLACLDEVPAGSLPNDDELNRINSRATPEEWAVLKDRIMGGWRLHQDGRLYHEVVSEVVLDVLSMRASAAAASAVRWGGKPRKPAKKKRAVSGRIPGGMRADSARNAERELDSEGEKKNPPTPLAGGGAEVVGFDAFWRVFPRRVGKLAAAKSYDRACKLTTPAAIQAAVEAFARASLTKDQQYLPHPATWLNQGRWSDEGPGLAPPASGAHGARPTPAYRPLGVGG